MKKTAIAPSNIAFTKYWGKKDEAARIPTHNTISMNLSSLLTTTTVEFSASYLYDDIIINGDRNEKEVKKVSLHLDRIRAQVKTNKYAKVVSLNNFPSSTGLSSSASGFAALTLAASSAAGLMLSEKELSISARMGSGSACRSIPSGFVEWIAGTDSESSYALSIFPPDHWDLVDIIAVVSDEKKKVPTTEGHKLAQSSPFYNIRLTAMGRKNEMCKQYIADRDFTHFGELIEQEALEMHAVMMTSNPPLIYWLPKTVLMIRHVLKWREEGLPCYFTINTGQDVHILCERKHENALTEKLRSLREVKKIISNSPSQGAALTDVHLF